MTSGRAEDPGAPVDGSPPAKEPLGEGVADEARSTLLADAIGGLA